MNLAFILKFVYKKRAQKVVVEYSTSGENGDQKYKKIKKISIRSKH